MKPHRQFRALTGAFLLGLLQLAPAAAAVDSTAAEGGRPGPPPAAAWLQGRAYLGVEVVELDPDLAAYFQPPPGASVLVTRVPETAAAAPGVLRGGDLILRVDGRDVTQAADIATALEARAAGDVVDVVVWRQAQRQTLRTVVAARATPFGGMRTATTGPGTDELRREIQKLRRDVEELRREVDILRRRR